MKNGKCFFISFSAAYVPQLFLYGTRKLFFLKKIWATLKDSKDPNQILRIYIKMFGENAYVSFQN